MIQPNTCALRNERGNDQRVDGNARRAGHQRRDQDRGHPVAAVVDDACGHDFRNGAGKARQQRDESAAMQPDAAHDAIHQERCSRHIAEIFEHQDKEEQDDDLRQEHDDAANPGNHAVLHEALQQAIRQHRVDQLTERSEAARQHLHQWLRPAEHGLRHDEQDREQDQETECRLQHHGLIRFVILSASLESPG